MNKDCYNCYYLHLINEDYPCKNCYEYSCWVPHTNEQNIQTMSTEELADFICSLAFCGHTPWSKPFADKFCKSCTTIECTTEDGKKIYLNECDFSDGVCPHGSDIEWWLEQPMEVNDGSEKSYT